MLTEAQKAFYETFGFVALRQLFSPDEMQIISSTFDEIMLADRGGKPFDGQQHQIVVGWCFKRPATEKLPEDPRICGPIEQLLGPG